MELDADGDLVVARKREEEAHLSEVHMERLHKEGEHTHSAGAATVFTTASGQTVAAIQHSMATPLGSVGLQVWRGALLLADYLLHRGPAALDGTTALELGAGPGLTGLVLAQLAPGARVFLTDAHTDVLANCQRNVEHNRPPAALGSSVRVRRLDWLDPPGWLLPGATDGAGASASGVTLAAEDSTGGGGIAWQAEDMGDAGDISLLLAADCIYDDTLTEACMHSAVLLMRHAARRSGRSPRLLVGLERRVVFTLADLEARAPAYDHWRTLLAAVERQPSTAAAAVGAEAVASAAAAVDGAAAPFAAQPPPLLTPAPPPFPLVGWRLDADAVPHAVQQYQRTQYLELWELALKEEEPRTSFK